MAETDRQRRAAVFGGGDTRAVAEFPPLEAYAQAFADAGVPAAAFLWWSGQHGWQRITLEPGPAGTEPPGVRMSAEPASLPHHLTTRELDVLTLMASGLSNTEIGARLVASPRTVSTHVEHILAKLGQTSRTGAAALAVERGYLRLPLPGQGPAPAGLTICYLHARAVGEAVGSQREQARASRAAAIPRAAATAAQQSGPGPASRRRPLPRPLRIGSAFPLTGLAGDDGQQMLNGSALAVAEINARGGIAGRDVEQLVVNVDIFSTRSVQDAFEQLFAADVDALTSGYVFREDLAVDLVAGYGAPYVHAMTSQAQAQAVQDDQSRYRNIFQVCPTEVHYGPGFVRFLEDARRDGWQPRSHRIAFVETALPSGQMVNALTIGLAEHFGWEIAGVQMVPAIGADWPTVVSQLTRLNPAAVMITQFLAGELAGFQRLAAPRLPDTQIYAIYSPSVPEFLDLAGRAAEGLVWATVTGTYDDAIGHRFRADYERATGRAPGWSHAGIAYDEVHLLAQAWMAAPNPRDFDAVSRQLRRVRYRGVNGGYFLDNAEQSGLSFPDTTADPSLGQAHLVLQVQDGAHRIISPAPYAEGRFLAPGQRLPAANGQAISHS